MAISYVYCTQIIYFENSVSYTVQQRTSRRNMKLRDDKAVHVTSVKT